QSDVQVRIVLLGTSSAVPTLTRGLSATALVREGDVFLFDCGEGTQLQLMRSSVKRSRIHSIFIGHLHGDHLYGIAGLLSTLHLDGRETPLNVFGPEGLQVFLNAAFRTSDLQFEFKLTLKELPRGFRGRVLDEEDFYVEALPLDHSIFCLGWRFQEKDKPGVFNIERAEELGIPRGPLYGRLQHGESITLSDSRIITPDMVLRAPKLEFRPTSALATMAGRLHKSVMMRARCLNPSRSHETCWKWKFNTGRGTNRSAQPRHRSHHACSSH